MFWVINKDKVYSYMVTLSVIGVLFAMATIVPKSETVETSAYHMKAEISNVISTN